MVKKGKNEKKGKINITKLSKKEKLDIICNLLLKNDSIKSQKALISALNMHYEHDFTQPTISKYLKELNIKKTDDGYRQEKADRQSLLENRIKDELKQVIGEISLYNDMGLIFVRLNDNDSGQARIYNIAHMLKYTYDDIFGTFVSDDCCLIITKDKVSALEVMKNINRLKK